MATAKDITDQTDRDIELLDAKILEALTLKNSLPTSDPQRRSLTDTINLLMDSRTDLHIQELRAGLNSAQLTAALARITTATHDLKTEADKMKDVTSFITSTNAVLGAATRVTNIVKNGG